MQWRHSLFAAVPLLGLVELGLHEYFAQRAPSHAEYTALGAELARLHRPGMPVVVAPAWAEPLVREAAGDTVFPLNELGRADDRGFARSIEVSLLGAESRERYPSLESHAVGPFRLTVRRNPGYDPARFELAALVERGALEVWSGEAANGARCPFVNRAHSAPGGLHGHVAYPARRYECPSGALLGVTLIEDRAYGPRRCILAKPASGEPLQLRILAAPALSRLEGYAGLSYFIERGRSFAIGLSLRRAGAELAAYTHESADWSAFSLGALPVAGDFQLRVEDRAGSSPDFCFMLEGR